MDEEQRAQLGEQIRKARNQHGWSQQRLAEEAGVSENTITSMEAWAQPEDERPKNLKRTQSAKVRAVLDALGIAPAAAVIALDGVPEDVKIFLTVATQRLRVMDEPERARVLADIYPRLLIGS